MTFFRVLVQLILPSHRFAWVNSLFAELVLVHLDQLEYWLKSAR